MKLFDTLSLICKFTYVVCFKGNVGSLHEVSAASKVIFLCSILFVVSWVYNESLASGGSHQNLHELSQDVPQRGRRRHVGGSQNSGRNPYLTYFIHTCGLQNMLRGLGPFCFEFILAHLSKWGLYYFMIDMVLYFMLVYLFKLFRTELLSFFVF